MNFLILSQIDDYYARLDLASKKLNSFINSSFVKNEYSLKDSILRLKNFNKLDGFENELETNFNKLKSLDVQSILDRGFSKVVINNKVVNSISDIKKDDKLKVEFKDGYVLSHVEEIRRR